MNRLEILSVAAALGVGSVVGFAGARFAQTNHQISGDVARRAESAALVATVPGEIKVTTAIRSDPLEIISRDPLRSRRLVALNRYCAGLDAVAARRAVESMPGDSSQKSLELRERLMSRWAELEPVAAAAFALGVKDANNRSTALQHVLKVWVAQDADAAKQFVAGLKDKDVLDGTLFSFTTDLAERDFVDALRFADAVPASHKQNVVWAAFRAAGQANPNAAIARAMAMPAGKLRESAIESAASVWLQQNPQAAMAWVMQRPDTPITFGRTLLQTAVQRWSFSEPAAAARFVQGLPAGKQREDFISNVASGWAWEDTGQALKWVQGLPEDQEKTRALSVIVNQWASRDPLAAAAFMARQPANEKTSAALQNIGRQWSAVDPDGALAWAAAQPDEALEKGVAPGALGMIAADDPARAIAGLAALRSLETQAAALTAIAKNWADLDPQEAARWVLELPEADSSRNALKEVISTGTARDPVAMAEWLDALKGDPRRDVAVEAFARAATSYDPLAAAAWANTLADAGTRRPLVQNLVRTIANFDEAAARMWVLGQSFEPGERAALLNQIDQQTKRK